MVNAKSLMHISSYYLNDSNLILIIFVKVLLAISHIRLRVCIFRVQDAGGLRESDSVSEMDRSFAKEKYQPMEKNVFGVKWVLSDTKMTNKGEVLTWYQLKEVLFCLLFLF